MKKTAFINCNLFDGRPDSEIVKCSIIVADGRIEKVDPENKVPDGCEIEDVGGRFVTPGLINPHVHLFGTGLPSKVIGGGKAQRMIVKLANSKAGGKLVDMLVRKSAEQQLLSGVTTVRGVGDIGYADVRVRDKINAGKFLGPRLLVSGPIVAVPGGHGSETLGIVGSDPEELKALVRRNKEAGVDLIKICVTGGVIDAKVKGEPGEVKMTLEQTKAVCDEAHRLGLRVASHTESPGGVKIAAAAGVDTVEHGAGLDEEEIRQMRENKACMDVTFSPALPLAKLDCSVTKLNPLCVYNSGIVVEHMIQGAKDCLEHGITLGMGTDSSCPFATQYNMWREVVYFKHNVGVSNAKALSIATLENARVVGVEDETGSVEAGKSADFIVMRKNPLEDLNALRDLDMVVARGHVIRDPKPRRMKAVEEHLEKMSPVL